jgi:hypothetical protein
MSGLDGIIGQIEQLAVQAGLPVEQVKSAAQAIAGRIAGGDTSVSALAETAAQYGLPAEKLEALLAQAGGPEALLGKLSGFLDRDGDGNPLNELGSLAKGLFG